MQREGFVARFKDVNKEEDIRKYYPERQFNLVYNVI